MFNVSNANFMAGMSQLGWTPPSVPTPAFGDMFNLNSVFNHTLGPSGLIGSAGAPMSLTAGFSGAIGGDLAGYTQSRIPTYGVQMQRTPVYNYQQYAFDNSDQSGCGPVIVGDSNGDGSVTTDDLMQNNSSSNCNHHQHQNGWESLKEKYADANGMIKGDALDHIQIWYDDNHDGQIQDDEFRHLKDYGIQGIDTNNGTIIKKNLLGYQCTPQQVVTGYYNFNTYSSTTGTDTQQFTYEPLTAGSSLQQAIAGGGGFATLPDVANYSGYNNNWGTTGNSNGLGYGYAWNGSGWGNGYTA